MKANEIMIGDWVRHRWTCCDTGREVVRDFQLAAIQKIGELLYAWSKGGNAGNIEDIEPILLTPEILEKNFEKNPLVLEISGKICQYGIYEDYFDFDIREYSDGLYVVTYHSCEFNIQDQTIFLSWVHELQHFMRHCGIEKDIVL